jgi:hypothetical protein
LPFKCNLYHCNEAVVRFNVLPVTGFEKHIGGAAAQVECSWTLSSKARGFNP